MSSRDRRNAPAPWVLLALTPIAATCRRAADSSVAGMTAHPAPDDGRPRAVVLAEGTSDRLALEVLARRRGRDLAANGVAVIAMHGATNIGHYLERYGPGGLNVKLAGLCDAAEEDY